MLISENVPSVHETHLYKSRTDLSQSKNQHQRCAANSSEIVKGLGMLPNKYAQVGTAVPCLLFLVFHNSKRHFLKWKSAATAALSAKKRGGRRQSMARSVHLDH